MLEQPVPAFQVDLLSPYPRKVLAIYGTKWPERCTPNRAWTGHLPYSGNNVADLQCERHHVAGGTTTLESVLGGETETATLAWLVSTLEHSRTRGHTKLVVYLEAVMEDVMFEVEAAARGRRYT